MSLDYHTRLWAGGWPRLSSEKCLWVAHPSTQSKDGVSSLVPFLFLFSSCADYHRMTWMRAPTFNFFHDLSAVYTGAFKESPSARQALSPKDKPSGRVCAIRSPASLACSEVNGTASRMGLSAASHASSGRRPRPTSLPCTSARLTVLMAAALKSSGVNVSAPRS